jgi:c-di-GMP-binding flagellar brake protein YcgR
MSSRSEDISEVGMRLAAMQRLRPGMVLELNFSLQESTDPIKTRAKIVWQDSRKNVYFPFSLGMEFIEITPIDRNQIKNYISKALQESKSIATPTLHH